VSRLYDKGYSALLVCFRRLVLVLMSLLPSLTPFELICPMRQAFKALSFKRIQFLRCFCFSSIIVAQKTLLVNSFT